jgi:translocator protein
MKSTPSEISPIKQAVGLGILVAACFGAAAAGSAATLPRIRGWYAALAKPAWTPPDWLFGPVWTVLYLAMAVAAWIVWRRKGWAGSRASLSLFACQLGLNVAWSWLFFGLQDPALGFVDVVLLWMAIAATLAAFWRISIAAGLLLVPYLAWVTFAASLNFAIWRMNDGPPASTSDPGPMAESDTRADESPSTDSSLKDDEFRKLAAGTWHDDYQGSRTLTLREDGTGTMVVELNGLKAALVARRLQFDMVWSIANGRLKKRSLGGAPSTQVSMILKTMGDTVDEPILELTEDRLLVLDQDGNTRYDWRRVR